ncbi:MAG: phosphodiester glycosidase family protein [Burkholderiaceae bacterium]
MKRMAQCWSPEFLRQQMQRILGFYAPQALMVSHPLRSNPGCGWWWRMLWNLRVVLGLLIGLGLTSALLTGCAHPLDPAGRGSGWKPIAAGLDHRDIRPGVQALRLDLQASGLRLRVSDRASAGQPIDQRADAGAALAAFNASFFDRQFRARGHTISQGDPWPEPLSPRNSPVLSCDDRQRCEVLLEPTASAPAGGFNVVGGTPYLVRNGQARTPQDDARCASLCAQLHPRTAIGLSANGRWLIVLFVEGRREDRPGQRLADTAADLKALGVHQGFNLDGGGSTALLVGGESRVQRPANEPRHRPLANVILIEQRPAPMPP